MLTVMQVAQLWNVSPGLIYKLVAAGDLDCHRIGNTLRFANEHLQAYLDAAPPDPKPKQTFSYLDL